MMFLMLACANNAGNPDNGSDNTSSDDIQPGDACHEVDADYPYGGTYDEDLNCEENDGMGGFASCDALASSYDETVWVPAGEDYSMITFDMDSHETPRPCLAVAWEISEDPGYQVSVTDNDSPKVLFHGEDEFPVYWVMEFDAYAGLHLFDPEVDPGGYENLPVRAGTSGNEYAKVPLNTYQFAE